MSFAGRTVSEILQRHYVALDAADRLDFADQVMRLGRIRHLPVIAKGKLVGIVSNRDILAASLTKVLAFGKAEQRAFLHSVDVSEVMSEKVVTVSPETGLAEAARLVLRHKIGCLPVVDAAGALIGLVTETDLLRAAVGDAEDQKETDAGPGRAAPERA